MPPVHTRPKPSEGSVLQPLGCRLRLQDIPGNESAKRGMELALAGGHGIAFVYQQGAPGPELLCVAQGMAMDAGIAFTGLAALPCPCGSFGTLAQPCTCSPKRFIAYRKKLARELVGYDMAVEVVTPWSERPAEPEERLLARINRARKAALEDTRLGRDCEDFLALYRREVSSLRMGEIRKVAATACCLEGCSRIQPCHLMEATQYQWLWNDLERLLPSLDSKEGSRTRA